MISICRKKKSDYPVIKKSLLCFLSAFLFCGVCFAQDRSSDKFKIATGEDILGIWRMTYQTVSPLFKDKSSFYQNFQIIEFSRDGYFKNIPSKKFINEDRVKGLLKEIPKSTTYSFINNGVVLIQGSRNNFMKIMISIANEDLDEPIRQKAPLIKKGELVVSYVDANNNMYMQRYFKRIDLKAK